MPVEILEETAATPFVPSAGAAGDGVAVPTRIRIEGVDRDAFTVTVGGKTVVYTERLTVLERRQLARAMMQSDVFAPEAYGFNLVAARVRQINGEAIGFPATESHIVDILTRLGDDAAEWLFEKGNEDFVRRTTEKAKN